METERLQMNEIVIGEYRVLLRMEGDLLLPIGRPKIRAFYEKLCQNTLAWGKQRLGRALCDEYAALADTRLKSRFPTTRCSLFTEIPFEDDEHVAIVLSARWSGKIEGVFRYVGVWQTEREELLPMREVKKHKKVAASLAELSEKRGKKD